MSDSLSSSFGTAGVLALSMDAAKLIALKQESVKSAHDIRGAIRKQFLFSYFLQTQYHNDYLPDSRNRFPETWTSNWEKPHEKERQLHRVE